MTEASHQMASNPLPPAKRIPGTVGLAAGPEVAIMDEQGNLLAPGQTGEIVIRGQSVMKGYENNPSANAEAFSNGWFRTGDQGRDERRGLYHDHRPAQGNHQPRGREDLSPRGGRGADGPSGDPAGGDLRDSSRPAGRGCRRRGRSS